MTITSNKKTVLIIGHNWPEPKTTAAGHRMIQLLEVFLERKYQIQFASAATKTKFSEDLTVLGIEELVIKLNHSSFDALVKKLDPDVVIFDRFMVEEQFGWRVAEHAPEALRILNTEDLHSLRDYREAAVKNEKPFNDHDWLTTAKAKREMASIFRSDLTLVVSDFEEKLLINRVTVPKSHVLHLPFILPALTDKEITAWPSFEERKNFVCFGNGKHVPNVDSILQLKKYIWPKIKAQLQKATLSVYGAYLPDSIKQLHNKKEGFLIQGWIDDLDTELQNTRLHLAPLRFGAGIKGKMVDAMQNGLPSITTRIGAEGMHNDLQWAGVICNDNDAFAETAVQLYQNPKQWQAAQQNGIEIINQIYDDKQLKVKFFEQLNKILSNLKIHRAQNFVGIMLQHQILAATKFMGKWIEEKNREI